MRWPWVFSVGLHLVAVIGVAATGVGVSFRPKPDIPVVLSVDVRPEPMILPRSCRVIFTEPVRAEPELERPPVDLDQPEPLPETVEDPPETPRPRRRMAVSCHPMPSSLFKSKPRPRVPEQVVSSPPQPVATRTSPRPPMPVTGNPPPRYPAAARRLGVEGTVVVRLRIDLNGRVLAAEVLKGSGSKLLDAAAIAALKRWRFTPGQDQKGAVESTVTVPVKFALQAQK